MIGKVLGNRYRILREIGAGGMAKVYLAEDSTSGDLVAVKVLYPQFSQDISFVQRFIREARLASTLTDPHIVHVLDYGADRDLQYLVMEYVEGKDLNTLLKERGALEWTYALELLDQLASALEHAHSHDIVHRDIKPQNLMLDESGLLKVLDFGIARKPALPSLTQSGFIGSPYYASPEQAMGEDVDIRSDIYSAGIVLYELLSGRIPFNAKSPWSIISQHISSDPPPINLPAGKIPASVDALLQQMLAKQPEQRYQTPTQIRQAIATAFAQEHSSPRINQPDQISLVESLSQRAGEALQAQKWARAVDLLSQAAKLDPGNTIIAANLAQAKAEVELEAAYKAGQKALDNGRWEEAVKSLSAVSRARPNDPQAAVLLNRAQKAQTQDNTHKVLADRYQEGIAHCQAGRWRQAVEVLSEVRRLAPGYEQVDQLLAEAQRMSHPSLAERLQRLKRRIEIQPIRRWGLLTLGTIAMVFLIALAFGNGYQVSGDDDRSEQLRQWYERALAAVEAGDMSQAVANLDRILAVDPDYADTAALRRELQTSSLLQPGTAASDLTSSALQSTLTEAEAAVEAGNWDQAIELLTEIKAEDAGYQPTVVKSLLCEAYVGRGLKQLRMINAEETEAETVELALVDFTAGQAECPRRTDLVDWANRTQAYQTVLTTELEEHDQLISLLQPIVAASPDFANGRAKHRLFEAYMERASREVTSQTDLASALIDVEAALALGIVDEGQARRLRSKLLLMLARRFTATPDPETTAEPGDNSWATPQPRATLPSSGQSLKYDAVTLLSPPSESKFGGRYSEVFVEWTPVLLAENEYYDLTIVHFFAGEPVYTGSGPVVESRVRLESQNIGVGQSDRDLFYWWVTVRKRAVIGPDGLDLALSPRSEANSFTWSP